MMFRCSESQSLFLLVEQFRRFHQVREYVAFNANLPFLYFEKTVDYFIHAANATDA